MNPARPAGGRDGIDDDHPVAVEQVRQQVDRLRPLHHVDVREPERADPGGDRRTGDAGAFERAGYVATLEATRRRYGSPVST